MKTLLIILALLFASPSFAGPNDPPAKAFTFQIEAGNGAGLWNVALFATQPLSGQIGLRLVTKKADDSTEWQYVNSEIIYESEVQEEALLLAALQTALDMHNARIKEYFLLDEGEVIPKTILEAVEQFISNGIEWNNKLEIK